MDVQGRLQHPLRTGGVGAGRNCRSVVRRGPDDQLPSWQEWGDVVGQVGPNSTAANLRGREREDTFNQGVSAIMVEEVTMEVGLESDNVACHEALNRSLVT